MKVTERAVGEKVGRTVVPSLLMNSAERRNKMEARDVKQQRRQQRLQANEVHAVQTENDRRAALEAEGCCYFCTEPGCQRLFLTAHGRRMHAVNCGGGRCSVEELKAAAAASLSPATIQKMLQTAATIRKQCDQPIGPATRQNNEAEREQLSPAPRDATWDLPLGWATHESNPSKNDQYSKESTGLLRRLFEDGVTGARTEAEDAAKIMKAYFDGGVGKDFSHRKSRRQIKAWFGRIAKKHKAGGLPAREKAPATVTASGTVLDPEIVRVHQQLLHAAPIGPATRPEASTQQQPAQQPALQPQPAQQTPAPQPAPQPAHQRTQPRAKSAAPTVPLNNAGESASVVSMSMSEKRKEGKRRRQEEEKKLEAAKDAQKIQAAAARSSRARRRGDEEACNNGPLAACDSSASSGRGKRLCASREAA